jgi:DNA-binding transcriptional LysR family regulator
MDWEALRIFLHAAEHRSLSAAAAGLRMSVPTLSRRIEALEHAIGATLFRRTPRGLVLTEHGEALQRRAEGGRRQMAEVERFAATLGRAAEGSVVRVSSTEPVIAEILAPQLGALLPSLKGHRLDLTIDNAQVSLALNKADIAVRLARPEGDSLMAKRLPPLAMAIYGSSEQAASDLSRAAFVSYDDSYGRIAELRWIEDNGFAGQVRVRTSSTRAMLTAAKGGHGLAILPKVFADRHAELIEVLSPDLPPVPPRDVWIVWHRDLHRRPAIRRTIRWIADCFAAAQPSVASPGKVSSSQ